MPETTASIFETADNLARLRQRDDATFRALVKQYQRKLVIFASTFTGRDTAEEVVQEAWVSIWKHLPKFSGKSLLKTWIYTIVRNECLARMKREGRLKLVSIDDGEHDGGIEGWMAANFAADGHWAQGPAAWKHDAPEAILEEAQLQDCLQKHMALLPAQQRAVFTMRELEQMELQDICNVLEISNSNVRVLLHRARLTLLQLIDHYQQTGDC